MEKRLVKSIEAKRILSCCTKTLENYETYGKLHPTRINKIRFYDVDELDAILGAKKEKYGSRKVIAYYRVSTESQRKEMKYQRESIENWSVAAGVAIDDYLFDIGSGLNFKRKNFLRIIDMIEKREISKLIVTFKDRLTRFAFELIEERCRVNDVELVVINLSQSSPEKEVVDDLMEIIHVFSSRLYGLRKYKIKKSDLLEEENKEAQDGQNPQN